MWEIIWTQWKINPFINLLDVCAMWYIFYRLLLIFRGSKAMQVLKGLIILVVISFVANKLELNTVSWVLDKLWTALVVALVVLFQDELRFGLAQIGRGRIFGVSLAGEERYLDEIVYACRTLSEKHTGALIVIQRTGNLQRYIETGTRIDAIIQADLLVSIFERSSPLHDGAVIIQGNRIAAATCILPLTQREDLPPQLGTRHRAALGITEEVDVVAIVISEETGAISVVIGGRLTRNLDVPTLQKVLKNIFAVD